MNARPRPFDPLVNPVDYFVRDPTYGPQTKVNGMRKFVQAHLVIDGGTGKAGAGHYGMEPPNCLVVHL